MAVNLNKKYKENIPLVSEENRLTYYEQPVRGMSYELRVEYTATQKIIIISDDISGQRLYHLKGFYESTRAIK